MVYVDPMMSWIKTNRWPYSEVSHLVADTEEELHRFAQAIGLKRFWYQEHESLPHYDLTRGMRARAVAYGAQEISRAEMALRIRAGRENANKKKQKSG